MNRLLSIVAHRVLSASVAAPFLVLAASANAQDGGLVAMASNSGPVCEGQDVQLFAGPDGYNYSWSGPNDFFSDEQNPVVSPAVPGEYCVTVYEIEGDSDTACTEVIVGAGFEATALNSGPVCDGADVQLFAGPDGLSYLWIGPGKYVSEEQNPIVSPAVAGQYCVMVSDEQGCSDTACTEVALFANPDCFISGPEFLCAGSSCNVFSGPPSADGDGAGAADVPRAIALNVALGSSPPVRYNWDIEGDATIVGPTDQEDVYVDPMSEVSGGTGGSRSAFGEGGGALGEFTLFLETTSADECTSTCSMTFPIIECPGEVLVMCEGCSQGYWRQPQHFSDWPAPYQPNDLFAETAADGEVFEDAFPGKTLRQVLRNGGGGLNALGRQTVAALLNGASEPVNFPYPPVSVITLFNDVFPGNPMAYELLKDEFELFNLNGCPIDGHGDADAVE